RVLDADAELAAPPVEVEGPGLKDRALTPVEAREIRKIVQDLEKVALVAEEPLDVDDLVVQRLLRRVPRDEAADLFARVATEKLPEPGDAELLDRAGRFGRRPGLVRRQALLHRRPVALVELVAVPDERRDRGAGERPHPRAPGGVDPVVQRQCAGAFD